MDPSPSSSRASRLLLVLRVGLPPSPASARGPMRRSYQVSARPTRSPEPSSSPRPRPRRAARPRRGRRAPRRLLTGRRRARRLRAPSSRPSRRGLVAGDCLGRRRERVRRHEQDLEAPRASAPSATRRRRASAARLPTMRRRRARAARTRGEPPRRPAIAASTSLHSGTESW